MESEETAATPTEFESDLEALAAEVYKARAQSPTWRRVMSRPD